MLRCARSAAVALGPASAANCPAGRLSWQAASPQLASRLDSCPQAVNAGEAGEQPGMFDPTGSPCSCTILSCSSSPQIQSSNPAPSPASAQGLIHGSPTLPTAIAACASRASPKEEDPPAPVEAESSETAHSASHSSAEDEPAADLNKAPKAHHFSCGLEVRCPPVHAMCTVLTLALEGPGPSARSRARSRDGASPWPWSDPGPKHPDPDPAGADRRGE